MKHRIEWHAASTGALVAFEPEAHEVPVDALVAAYNDAKNAPLLGHTQLITADDVREHYAGTPHPFVFLHDGAFAGDGDLRGVEHGAAEFAFLIAAPSAQGKGLGTRFATMVHAFAFRSLGLERVYASVIPENVASRRVFEKLGYIVDETTDYGDDGDIVLRIDRARFLADHAAALAEIQIAATSLR